MEIRRARPSDVSAIGRIEKESFTNPWSVRDILASITAECAMSYVAVQDGETIGYLLGSLIAPEGEIFRIAVTPSYRKRGIGYRLLDGVVRAAKEDGLTTLFLEVRSQNEAARALYRSYGFFDTGRRINYYKNPTDDAYLMMKPDV